jgi:hypothetical protein
MDSAVLGLASFMRLRLLYGARFQQKFTLEAAIELHAFAPLEALLCV